MGPHHPHSQFEYKLELGGSFPISSQISSLFLGLIFLSSSLCSLRLFEEELGAMAGESKGGISLEEIKNETVDLVRDLFTRAVFCFISRYLPQFFSLSLSFGSKKLVFLVLFGYPGHSGYLNLDEIVFHFLLFFSSYFPF